MLAPARPTCRDRTRRAPSTAASSMEPQIDALAQGRRRRRRHARAASSTCIERGELSLDRGRGARDRRGRPHGRHGLHAPGPEDPLPASSATAPDDAVLGHARRRGRSASSTATCTTRCTHEVESRRADRRRDGAPLPPVHQMDKVKVVAVDRQRRRPHPRVLRTKRGADRLVDAARARGREGRARSTATCARARASGRWPTSRAGKVPVLVATDVAARGIHVDGVDVVVHYDPPEDHKAYLHRSGRTARAGESGVAVTLCSGTRRTRSASIQRRLGLSDPGRRGVLQRPAPRRPRELGRRAAAPGRRLKRRPKRCGSARRRACDHGRMSRDLAPRRRHHRVGHAGGRRQGQGAAGRGRGRHRLRRRRARLPDAARTSSRRRSRRAATRATTTTRRPPGLPELRAAIAAQDQARLRATTCDAAAGARHQRRQARGLQHVPGAARPGRRGAAARAVLDDVSRGDHARRRRAGRAARPPRRTGFRVTVEQLEAARTPRTKALLFVSPSNPTGAVYPPAEVEAIGRWAVEHGIWVVTDEIYEHLTYGDHGSPRCRRSCPSSPSTCVVLNGVAKTYAMTGWRVGWMIGPRRRHHARPSTCSRTRRRTSPTSRSAPRSPRSSGDLDAVAEMRAAFERRGHDDARAARGDPRRHVPRAARARSTASRRSRACSAARSRGRTPHDARSSCARSCSTRRRSRSCPARRSARPATRACRSRSATTTSARASSASPSSCA